MAGEEGTKENRKDEELKILKRIEEEEMKVLKRIQEEESSIKEHERIIEEEEKRIKDEEDSIKEEEEKIEREVADVDRTIKNIARHRYDIGGWKSNIWNGCEHKKGVSEDKEIIYRCDKLKSICKYEDCPKNLA